MKNVQKLESKAVVGKGGKHVFSNSQKLRLYILLGVVVILMAGLGWYLKYYQNKPAVSVCSDSILKEAVPVLDRSKTGQLKPIASKIEQLKRFDKDPNCLYVVVIYDINTGDLPNARLYFDKLKKLYDPEKGFSSYLGSNVKSIPALEQDIKFLEARDKAVKNNIITFPNE